MNTSDMREYLILALLGGNPYLEFDPTGYVDDIQCNGNPELLLHALSQIKPRLIVEVGAWKGYSTTLMADWIKNNQQECLIISVDTWLGSSEHIKGDIKNWSLAPYRVHGYPNLYYHFLANICRRSHQGIVVPFPQTSTTAARALIRLGVKADMVYIDASHEEEDVQLDLEWYWRILRYGGCMVGDDIRWAGVYGAVKRFSASKGLEQELTIHEGKWLLQKVLPSDVVDAIHALATHEDKLGVRRVADQTPLSRI